MCIVIVVSSMPSRPRSNSTRPHTGPSRLPSVSAASIGAIDLPAKPLASVPAATMTIRAVTITYGTTMPNTRSARASSRCSRPQPRASSVYGYRNVMLTPTAVASPEMTTASADTSPRSAGSVGRKPAATAPGSAVPRRTATTPNSATISQTIQRISRSKAFCMPPALPKLNAVGTAHSSTTRPIHQRCSSRPATVPRSTSTADASEYCAKCHTTDAITVPIAQPHATKGPAYVRIATNGRMPVDSVWCAIAANTMPPSSMPSGATHSSW